MLQDTDQAGVEAAAWLLGYLATDPANGRPLISLGAAPALVCIYLGYYTTYSIKTMGQEEHNCKIPYLFLNSKKLFRGADMQTYGDGGSMR